MDKINYNYVKSIHGLRSSCIPFDKAIKLIWLIVKLKLRIKKNLLKLDTWIDYFSAIKQELKKRN